MKLVQLVNKFDKIEIASQEDNQEILKYFYNMPVENNGMSFTFDRSPNYFKFLQYISPTNFTFICRDKKGKISGIISFIIRNGYISHEIKKIGYFCDLRIKLKKDIVLYWRKFFTELLLHINDIEEFKGVKYIYTAIHDENKKAMDILLHSKKNNYNFKKLMDCKTVNIFGQSILSSIKKYYEYSISTGKDSEYPEIRDFLNSEQSKKAFGYVHTKEGELDYRFENWPNTNMTNFVIAKDVNKRIVCAFSLWSSNASSRKFLQKCPFKLRVILGLISNVKDFPKDGSELKTLYINNLEFAANISKEKKLEIFLEMLSFIYKNSINKGYNAVTFTDYSNYDFFNKLRGFITNYQEMSLYTVSHKNHSKELLTNTKLGASPPGFEVSLS